MDRTFIAGELLKAAKEVQANRFEFPPEIAHLERKFSSATQNILNGISAYEEVMEKLARMDEYPDAEEIGKRGADTAKQRYRSWQSISDDFHVLHNMMAKRDREG